MSDGLFFTGQVLKNNRDLLREDATRQQLAMQKESLELRKQQLADRKKEARRQGSKAKIKDYSVEGMDPFLVDQFQSQVGQYQGFANENAMAIYDGDNEAKNQQLGLERDLTSNKSKYDNISSDLTSLNNLVTAGKADDLKLTEDGEYLYEYNWNQVQEAVNSGEMDLDQALEAYPIDAQSMVNQSDFVPFYMANDDYFEKDDNNREGKGIGKDGYEYLSISEDQKAQTATKLITKLRVNKNNNHNDSNAARVYNIEQFTIDGERMTGKEAFFLEAYKNENGDLEKITAPSDTLIGQLDPQGENFSKELSDQYAEYLGKKISDREYENRGPRRGSKTKAGEEALSKDSISLLESPSEQLKNINNISVKLDDNKSAVVRDVTKVSVFLEDLQGVEGQNVGDKETKGTFLYNKNWYDSDSDSIEANLQRIALTEDNRPVAVMEYKGSSFLVPLGRLDSSLFKNKFEKGSTGAKIIEYSNLKSSQQGGGAKVPGELD
ncbi:hypothetical protein OAA03_00655 [bacterium]|nr:hypothetical protein [bacterium]